MSNAPRLLLHHSFEIGKMAAMFIGGGGLQSFVGYMQFNLKNYAGVFMALCKNWVVKSILNLSKGYAYVEIPECRE